MDGIMIATPIPACWRLCVEYAELSGFAEDCELVVANLLGVAVRATFRKTRV